MFNFANLPDTKSKKVKQSQENLLEDSDSASECYENLAQTADHQADDDNDNLVVTVDTENKSYIFNKFFENSQGEKSAYETMFIDENHSTILRQPVPKPRQKLNQRRSSLVSQNTFELASPKILKKPTESGSSTSSNKTYKVPERTEEIGEVVIHNEKAAHKISIKTVRVRRENTKFLEKGDTETLSDNHEYKADVTSSSSTESNSKKNVENIEMVEIKRSDNTPGEVTENKSESSKEDETRINKQYTYKDIVEIIVHKCDRLKLDSLVIHPLVKVHLVDCKTGKYISKSDKNRSVVFFYENKDCGYVSPVMTHAFDLQKNRTLAPAWEETIVLNEDYEYLMDESHRIILFFEVLDFLSVSDVSQRNSKGWHKIAFAFLKILGKNNLPNTGKKVRLQLYYHANEAEDNPHKCGVWELWKKNKLKKYPSTLYVTVKSLAAPQTESVEVLRSKTPVQREKVVKSYFININDNELLNCEEKSGSSEVLDKMLSVRKSEKFWSRLPRETCKLPNKCVAKFHSYDEGCFCMQFSSKGQHLACAVRTNDMYSLAILSVFDLQEVLRFPCHQGLVYDIKWSPDDSLIITASADNTVSLFNFRKCSFIQILPHPSFVYSCDIFDNKIIATGCFDRIVRIWNNVQENGVDFGLVSELESHKGYVTSVCFSRNQTLFSGDSLGVIIEWAKDQDTWAFNRIIHVVETKTIINQIILHPKQKKLLCHLRDCTIRAIDIKSGCILQCLQGFMNKRIQIYSTISPCGTYFICGSENGLINVWNVTNGELLATYAPYTATDPNAAIHCVRFHPFDNILAISHYGKNLPILVFNFTENASNKEVNLRIFDQDKWETGPHKRNIRSAVSSDGDKMDKTCVSFRKHVRNKTALGNEKLDTKEILRKMDKIISS